MLPADAATRLASSVYQADLYSDKVLPRMKTPDEILGTAAEHLRTARRGLSDMERVPGRARSGFHNAVVFGRMVSWALQNLRSVVKDFDSWYGPEVAQMMADPLYKYFSDLRTKIEKQAHAPLATDLFVHHLNTADLPKLFGDAPPGAVAMFVGDADGASGWVVKTPDGGTERFYVELPADAVTVEFRLKDLAPEVAAGRTPAQLTKTYLDRLAQLLAEAGRRFSSSA
jgi:hypothetical protein